MRQTSGTARTAASTLTGKNPSPRKIRKVWPAPMVNALSRARVRAASSLPDQRTSRLPEASQKASPKRMPGTAPTSASWRSSTVLMKCDWPKMKLAASGLTMGTTVSSMAELQQVSYAVHGRPPEGDCKPPQALDFTPYRACHRLPRGSRTLGHFAGRVDGAEARCSDQGSQKVRYRPRHRHASRSDR